MVNKFEFYVKSLAWKLWKNWYKLKLHINTLISGWKSHNFLNSACCCEIFEILILLNWQLLSMSVKGIYKWQNCAKTRIKNLKIHLGRVWKKFVNEIGVYLRRWLVKNCELNWTTSPTPLSLSLCLPLFLFLSQHHFRKSFNFRENINLMKKKIKFYSTNFKLFIYKLKTKKNRSENFQNSQKRI